MYTYLLWTTQGNIHSTIFLVEGNQLVCGVFKTFSGFKLQCANLLVATNFLFNPSCDNITLACQCLWAERRAANGQKLMRHIDISLSSLIQQCSSKSCCNEEFFKAVSWKPYNQKLKRSKKWRLALWFPALLKDLLCWSKWCLTFCRELLPSSWKALLCCSCTTKMVRLFWPLETLRVRLNNLCVRLLQAGPGVSVDDVIYAAAVSRRKYWCYKRLILLFEEFVSTKLHQDVHKSVHSRVLGHVHPIHILFCFIVTQLNGVLHPHQLTCKRYMINLNESSFAKDANDHVNCFKAARSPRPVLNSAGVRNPMLRRSRLSNTSSSCSGDSGSSPCSLWPQEVGAFRNPWITFCLLNTSRTHLHVSLRDEALALFVTQHKQLLGLSHGLRFWASRQHLSVCGRSQRTAYPARHWAHRKAPQSGAHWYCLTTALTHQHFTIIQPLRHGCTVDRYGSMCFIDISIHLKKDVELERLFLLFDIFVDFLDDVER